MNLRAIRSAWSHLASISLPFWRSEVRWRARGLITLVIGLALTLNGLNVVNSFVGREFMSAIAERRSQRFVAFALFYLAVFAGSTVVAVLTQFTQDRLALLWRLWLSRRLVQGYLGDRAYYRIQTQAKIDNPDQRIADDVKTFTAAVLSFFVMTLNAAITIIAFASILWLITPWLLLTAVVYAACGSLVTVFLGRSLPGFDNRQLVKEADLRYALVRIREYAESISLLRGENDEKKRLDRRLDGVRDNFRRIIGLKRNVGFFTSFYNYLVPTLPVVIIAPRYLRGEIEFGVVTQAAMAFAQILGALSLVIAQYQPISEFAAVVVRLSAMHRAIQQAGAVSTKIEIIEDEMRVAYQHVTLKTPLDGKLLVRDLSIEINPGMRLLISGSNGAGKSALFRATAGIWSDGSGRVVRPHDKHVMFLPQRAYLIPGTLREQLVYGLHEQYSDERLLAVLREIDLESVAERVGGLDVQGDWTNWLSHGEQQLVAIARLLLGSPSFAFLDDAVSAVDPGHAERVYETLAGTKITYLSIGDRSFLQDYHDTRLELIEGGRWRLIGAGTPSLA